jgi:hypothetical protein
MSVFPEHDITSAHREVITRLCRANNQTWLTTHAIMTTPVMTAGSYAYAILSDETLPDGTPAGFLLFKTQECIEFVIHSAPSDIDRMDAVELYACVVDKSMREQGILTRLLERLFAATDAVGRTVWIAVANDPHEPTTIDEQFNMWWHRGFKFNSDHTDEIVMVRPAPAIKCRPQRLCAH